MDRLVPAINSAQELITDSLDLVDTVNAPIEFVSGGITNAERVFALYNLILKPLQVRSQLPHFLFLHETHVFIIFCIKIVPSIRWHCSKKHPTGENYWSSQETPG